MRHPLPSRVFVGMALELSPLQVLQLAMRARPDDSLEPCGGAAQAPSPAAGGSSGEVDRQQDSLSGA